MSDQEDKNIEQIGEEGQAADAVLEESTSPAAEAESSAPETPAPVATPEEAPPQPAPARKGSSAIAWLALLLVLALAGAAGWSVMELQRRESTLLARVAELETATGAKETNLQDLGKRWQRQLQAGLGKLEEKASRQDQLLKSFGSRLAEQRAELARYSANDRESWLLAEAEYLLRLANQRLIMAGDTVAAQALLSSADNVLLELDDVSLHGVRRAVAADLAAVRAVPKVDVQGIYLRLAALTGQADKLVIFQLPEQEEQPEQAPAEGWQKRLQQGYEEALGKLSDYVIIRRRDVPMQALMDPQWEGLVRQNLRMLLEQAQVALLSGNQLLYSESLQRAQHWVGEFFESDEAAARAMAREITQLTDLNIEVTMPDISRSLVALDNAIEKRLQQGGGE